LDRQSSAGWYLGKSGKLMPGIVSAGPPPWALAAPTCTDAVSSTAANIFNIVFDIDRSPSAWRQVQCGGINLPF